MKTFIISVRNVYGNQNAYPECGNSRLFAELIGKKTFSTRDFNIITKLGFNISFKQQSFELRKA